MLFRQTYGTEWYTGIHDMVYITHRAHHVARERCQQSRARLLHATLAFARENRRPTQMGRERWWRWHAQMALARRGCNALAGCALPCESVM